MRVVVAVLVVVVAVSRPAGATPPGLTPEGRPTVLDPGTPSYRLQTAGVDALALGLVLVSPRPERDVDRLFLMSIGTYLLGAPLVHVSHGRTGEALASAGMRAGLPLLGALLGDALRSRRDSAGPSDSAVIGFLAGFAAASVLDTAYLAKGEPPRAKRLRRVRPIVRPTSGGVAIGVRAAF